MFCVCASACEIWVIPCQILDFADIFSVERQTYIVMGGGGVQNDKFEPIYICGI